MTRKTFLYDLWASYMMQPPSKENSLCIQHLEMLMDEIQSTDGSLPMRKFVGEVTAIKTHDGLCKRLSFTTAGGPFNFDVDNNPGIQNFLGSVFPTELAVRKKWEVTDKLMLTLVGTKVLEAQWYVPWDGIVGPWKTTKSYRGKEFHYRVISPWLQLAEFVEYVELRRLIEDRFMVYNCIAPAAALENLVLTPAARDDSQDPEWLSRARYAFKEKVEEKRIHHQYCSKKEARDHIDRIIRQHHDGFSALKTSN